MGIGMGMYMASSALGKSLGDDLTGDTYRREYGAQPTNTNQNDLMNTMMRMSMYSAKTGDSAPQNDGMLSSITDVAKQMTGKQHGGMSL